MRASSSCPTCAAKALTIVECLAATVIIAIVGLAMVTVISSGCNSFAYSDMAARCISLADDLLEEIAARPLTGMGSSRSAWGVRDYDGFSDGAGSLTDFAGEPYPAADQALRREVSVSASSITVPDLNGFTISGQSVTVRVEAPSGDSIEIQRFVVGDAP